MFIWNDHHKLEGLHAFLGASNYHWINWNDETLIKRYYSQYSTTAGTAIHELAEKRIKNKRRIDFNDIHLIEYVLDENGVPKGTVNEELVLNNLVNFVNDSIDFGMDSEVILYYSMDCFGTTDAISYDEKHKLLRIFDLKTGTTPAHMEQLVQYAALFFIEYHKKPQDTKVELRIYQNGEIIIYEPTVEELEKRMQLILRDCKILNEVRCK